MVLLRDTMPKVITPLKALMRNMTSMDGWVQKLVAPSIYANFSSAKPTYSNLLYGYFTLTPEIIFLKK